MQSFKSLAVLLLGSIVTALPQGQGCVPGAPPGGVPPEDACPPEGAPPGDAPPVTLTTITAAVPTPDCTFKPTQTITATTGCPTACATWANNCWDDRAIELACGCSSMTVQPVTETVCPTVTACMQCTTGWGLFTVTPTNCPTPTPTPL